MIAVTKSIKISQTSLVIEIMNYVE